MKRWFISLFREQAARPDGGIPQILRDEGNEHLYPHNTPIHASFEEQAAKTPGAVALIFDRFEMTYDALNRRANRIARLLIGWGVKRGDLIGLSLPKEPDMLAALLAIMKAGGAYLPLDPVYPAIHLQNILQNAKPKWVISASSICAGLPIAQEKVLCLDSLEEKIAAQSDENPGVKVDPSDLVYCIYTSGSTGKPKGVLVEHHSLVNFVSGAQLYYNIRPDDRMLQFASLNFDTSSEEIFPALCSGAVLALRTPDMLDSIPRFLQRCRDWQLTILDLPTAFWHELVMYLQKSGERLPGSVRLIIIGGERVSPAHLTAWHKLGTDAIHLDNTYGLTECTCVSVRGRLLPEEREEYSKQEASIGKPVDHTRIYILDDNRQAVPAGETGELYIGGEGLARGYLNLPELTAERFLADPFNERPGSRMYKTGDLVRMRPDGSLEYLGRSDEQIKIRGFRIEPAEIESALMQFKHVKDALVIKRSDPSGSEQLLAYLVAQKDGRISEKGIARVSENTPAQAYAAVLLHHP